MLGVVLVHVTHGLVYAVWIATAAFSAIDRELEEAGAFHGCISLRTLPRRDPADCRPGLLASAVFVFLESLDEFTGTYFVGAPDISTCRFFSTRQAPAANYQIASITALILLFPRLRLCGHRTLPQADVLSKVGR